MENFIQYVVSIISALGTLTALIIFFVTRSDNKKKEEEAKKEKEADKYLTQSQYKAFTDMVEKRLAEGTATFNKINESLADLERNDFTNAEEIGKNKTAIAKNTTRIDILRSDCSELEEKVKETKMENSRQSLLLLLSLFPKKVDAIFTEAKTYFITYNGDSYVHGLFNDWLKKTKVEAPEWYESTKKGE